MEHTEWSVEHCREELRRLEEENQHLRESANAFADLAERLTQALGGGRRAGHNPKAWLRDEPRDRAEDRR